MAVTIIGLLKYIIKMFWGIWLKVYLAPTNVQSRKISLWQFCLIANRPLHLLIQTLRVKKKTKWYFQGRPIFSNFLYTWHWSIICEKLFQISWSCGTIPCCHFFFLIGCMDFLSLYLDVTKTHLSTVSFLVHVNSRTFCFS